MKVLVTGATGVIGSGAVTRLAADGHEVRAVLHSPDTLDRFRGTGIQPVTMNLFDPASVAAAVADVDTVIHLASAMPPYARLLKADAWAVNDRIRVEGTRTLVDAALEARVERFVFASVVLVYADGGSRWLDESAPVKPPWAPIESALVGEREVERLASAGRTGVVLRMGRLYGPGRASRDVRDAILRRRVPILGSGSNHVSSLHADDAATAVAASMRVPGGTWNVVDDDPVTSARYWRALAVAVGAPRPRRLPAVVGRLLLGGAARYVTVSQRVSNHRFRQATGWAPRFRSVEEGWPASVAPALPSEIGPEAI
jgi:nucleoside-diphosphate-sugar epimerase